MIRIALLSDTHGHLDEAVINHLRSVDEIWHAGDFGAGVADYLKSIAPLRGVFGNVDDPHVRRQFPETLSFGSDGLKVVMLHIGGYPGRYTAKARSAITRERPGLFISGHSHILRIMPDAVNHLLHINPGAAGYEGFHQVRTMVSFQVAGGRIDQLKVIELGARAAAQRQRNIIG